MVTPLKHTHHQFLTKKLLPWALYSIIPIALFRMYFFPFSQPPQSPQTNPISITFSQEKIEDTYCDYSKGKWVHDKIGPLYNQTTCGSIKDGQNCISHGRPDLGFLFWKWKPINCNLPRFEPIKFLQILSNKHLAFVGDSMARNQLESLLCMLSTVSSPNLVYVSGEDNKFRRWNFPAYDFNLSVYWSPFLVKGEEKTNSGLDFNKLYLDFVDEKWAADLGQIDMIVFSIGHWFLHPAVYFSGGSVMGCHYCPGQNYTEIGFYDVLRKALKTTFDSVIGNGNGIEVILTTFSPAHFEGEWDNAGACRRTKPYEEGEKSVEGMDAEMRRIEVEEVETAKRKVRETAAPVRITAVDVTELALMRPDGHPGPYMHAFPFANGVSEKVQNDCVHWCLPGPIDTWNDIFLQIIRKRN